MRWDSRSPPAASPPRRLRSDSPAGTDGGAGQRRDADRAPDPPQSRGAAQECAGIHARRRQHPHHDDSDLIPLQELMVAQGNGATRTGHLTLLSPAVLLKNALGFTLAAGSIPTTTTPI